MTLQNMEGEKQRFRGTHCLNLHQRWRQKITIRRRKCVSDLRKTAEKHCQNSQPGQDKTAYFWNTVWHHYCYNQLAKTYLQQKHAVREMQTHTSRAQFIHWSMKNLFRSDSQFSKKCDMPTFSTPKMQNDIQYWSQHTWPEVKKYNL
jgi:hypothetical protein